MANALSNNKPGFVKLTRSHYGESENTFLHRRRNVGSVDGHLLGAELHGSLPVRLLRLHLRPPLPPLLFSQKALL